MPVTKGVGRCWEACQRLTTATKVPSSELLEGSLLRLCAVARRLAAPRDRHGKLLILDRHSLPRGDIPTEPSPVDKTLPRLYAAYAVERLGFRETKHLGTSLAGCRHRKPQGPSTCTSTWQNQPGRAGAAVSAGSDAEHGAGLRIH